MPNPTGRGKNSDVTSRLWRVEGGWVGHPAEKTVAGHHLCEQSRWLQEEGLFKTTSITHPNIQGRMPYSERRHRCRNPAQLISRFHESGREWTNSVPQTRKRHIDRLMLSISRGKSKRWASRGGSEEERQRDEDRKRVMSLK